MSRIILFSLVLTAAHMPLAQAAEDVPPPPAMEEEPGPDAAAAADLTTLLSGVESFQADFVQYTRDSRGEDLQQVTGRVWVEKPNLFRWKAAAPLNQEIVSDGRQTWFYDIDLAQVIVRNFDPEISKTPLLLLSGDAAQLQSAFAVRSELMDEVRSFILTPLGVDSLIEQLALVFHGRDLTAIRMVDSLGQRTDIEFSDAVRNGPIDEKQFQFVVPQGVDLIEDYESAPDN